MQITQPSALLDYYQTFLHRGRLTSTQSPAKQADGRPRPQIIAIELPRPATHSWPCLVCPFQLSPFLRGAKNLILQLSSAVEFDVEMLEESEPLGLESKGCGRLRELELVAGQQCRDDQAHLHY